MALFSDKDKKDAIEQSLKEKLRQHGLSHLSAKVRVKSSDKFEITLEGGTQSEIDRAYVALGCSAPENRQSDLDLNPKADLGRMNSELKIDSNPIMQTTPKISTGPKCK
jgi:hypothetical protein